MTSIQNVEQSLSDFVRQEMCRLSTVGVAMALTDRERTTATPCFGFANREQQTSVTADTLYEIGSISKSFTSVGLLQMAEQSRVDLDAPMEDCLPGFCVRTRFEPVTPHHLMSHSAGITSGMDLNTDGQFEVWDLRHTETSCPPGSYYHYSNVGYRALGLLLEHLHGRAYDQIIPAAIFEPLEMSASKAMITHAERARLATGYADLDQNHPYPPGRPLAPATWVESYTGEGSIASTAADMARYVRMLLNRGRGALGRVLSPESFEDLVRPVVATPDEGVYYGHGLRNRQDGENRVVYHTGSMVGYSSVILADLTNGVGVVVLVNGPGDAKCLGDYALALMRAAARGETLPPAPTAAGPLEIAAASDYAGVYRSDRREFTLKAQGNRLVMEAGDEQCELEQRSPGCFYAGLPGFTRFYLVFERQDGEIAAAGYGSEWFTNGHYSGPRVFDYPVEWNQYAGRYRSHNPWWPGFQVLVRAGRLILADLQGDEQALAPLGAGVFRVSNDPNNPERLVFDAIHNGQALRAQLNNGLFYRTRDL